MYVTESDIWVRVQTTGVTVTNCNKRDKRWKMCNSIVVPGITEAFGASSGEFM